MNHPRMAAKTPAENIGNEVGNEGKDRRKKWDSENSITETEIVTADKNGAIKSVRIEKVGEAHHVFVKLTWRKEELCLTTTRAAGKPREFKDFSRLVEYIQKTLPSVTTFEVQIEHSGDRDRRE